MAAACQACSPLAHSSSADDAAHSARHLLRNFVTGVWEMFVDMNAFVLMWAKLSRGFRQRGFERHRSFGDALGHAHGEAVGIARSRSW
jgi:hypothetical protein